MAHDDENADARFGNTYEELAGIANSPVEEALAMARAALESAARAADPARALEIDRGALLVLRDARHIDGILEELELDVLASLADRWCRRLEAEGEAPAVETRRGAWEVLDLLRRVPVRRRIAAAGAAREWADRILRLIDLSHLTFGTILQRHAALYGSKTLLQIPTPSGVRSLSWRQVAARVDSLARGLLSLAGDGEPPRVAILSENRLEMAIADLACLSAGLVDVIIPGNATEADAGYMLRHSRCRIAIVSGREQLQKVLHDRESLPQLERIFVMDPAAARGREAVALDTLAGAAGQVSPAAIEERMLSLRSGELATIMYTSGTTGMPKGIQFSHRSIVFKRFARALALPEIGEEDVFLCYLPLFHTFGRFFELFGCIFWGATYCFQDNPSPEALVQGMRRFRPTVFISVPKKWIQLFEAIGREADVYTGSDREVGEAVRRITGGRLRWGLSAAGRLDPDIFRFFQRYGVGLLSGFGMTEATGGITMTPPGRYKDDSLGPALPGIELRIADDGELLIRGPYVTIGYLDPPDGAATFDGEGWLHTGDLMVQDDEGFIRLIDRKKEIYKNIKGETIAPQRIEGLFRDFESVGRVFLVGDHREFNTALIWPNPEARRVDFASLSPDELQAHFASIVHSVNGFLAPYERIVDFAVIDRDLDPDRGELTPKGTPRRKLVEENFAPVIRLLYRRTTIHVGGAGLIFPNWLFQALALTAQDLRIGEDRISLPAGGDLRVRRLRDGLTQVGSCVYRHPAAEPLQLGVLLTTPRLWLGNEELVDFAPLEVGLRARPGRAGDPIELAERVAPAPFTAQHAEGLRAALEREAHDLLDLHLAALAFASRDETAALAAAGLLERVLAAGEGPLSEPARLLLARAASSPSLAVRRAAFLAVVTTERDFRFRATLSAFLRTPGILLDGATRAALCERDFPAARLDAFLEEAWQECSASEAERGLERRAASLLRFLADYGAAHPTRYRRVRWFLVRAMLFGGRESLRREAERAVAELEQGFRRWLGPTTRVSVDLETGREYRWEDVVAFDEAVPAGDRARLLAAIRETPVIREAVFLFSGGAAPRMGDIPPGGSPSGRSTSGTGRRSTGSPSRPASRARTTSPSP